jgi:hypothetical protein
MGLLRPDMGKLLYLAVGIALAAYTGITRFLPRKG